MLRTIHKKTENQKTLIRSVRIASFVCKIVQLKLHTHANDPYNDDRRNAETKWNEKCVNWSVYTNDNIIGPKKQQCGENETKAITTKAVAQQHD